MKDSGYVVSAEQRARQTRVHARQADGALMPRWGLGYMLNLAAGPNGRSAGTVSWGGLFNTYYWLDPSRRVTGLIMTQILPLRRPARAEGLRAVRARRVRRVEGA